MTDTDPDEAEAEPRGRPTSVTMTIENHPYTFRPGELDGWTATRFLDETGVEVEHVLRDLDEGATLVSVSRFVYLCALQSGQEPDSYEQVARRLSPDKTVEMSATFADVEDDEAIEEGEAAPIPPSSGSDETSEEPSPPSPITSVSAGRT